MLTEQSKDGALKAPMFRASKLTFLLKDRSYQSRWRLDSRTP